MFMQSRCLILIRSHFNSLERLETHETERLERLRRTVLPTPPEPLGFATSDSQTSWAKQRAILQQENTVDLKTLPPMPRFWDKYANQFQGKRDDQSTKMEFTPAKNPPSLHHNGDDDDHNMRINSSPSPSAASEMDVSRDSYSVFSPIR